MPDSIQDSKLGSTSEQDLENQKVPYSRFKEVNDKAKDLELRLQKLEEEKTLNIKTIEEDKLRAQGDYKALTEKNKLETEKALNAAKNRIVNAFYVSLGAKHNILDTTDVKLFSADVQFDENLNIKNEKEITDLFEKEFVSKKSYLFKQEDKKPIPKTDNLPFRKDKIDSKDQPGTITTLDIMKQRLEGVQKERNITK